MESVKIQNLGAFLTQQSENILKLSNYFEENKELKILFFNRNLVWHSFPLLCNRTDGKFIFSPFMLKIYTE